MVLYIHTIDVTLGDLLKQPDYAGCDYEDGLENATMQDHAETTPRPRESNKHIINGPNGPNDFSKKIYKLSRIMHSSYVPKISPK